MQARENEGPDLPVQPLAWGASLHVPMRGDRNRTAHAPSSTSPSLLVRDRRRADHARPRRSPPPRHRLNSCALRGALLLTTSGGQRHTLGPSRSRNTTPDVWRAPDRGGRQVSARTVRKVGVDVRSNSPLRHDSDLRKHEALASNGPAFAACDFSRALPYGSFGAASPHHPVLPTRRGQRRIPSKASWPSTPTGSRSC